MTHKIKQNRYASWLVIAGLFWSPSALAREPPSGPQFFCENARATYDILDCLKAELKKADEKLRTINRQLDNALSKAEQDKLHKANASWLRYLEDNCDSESFIYDGGTLEGVVYLYCKLDLTLKRTERLREAYRHPLRDAGIIK